MRNSSLCGLFFIAIILAVFSFPAFCAQSPPRDLEPIIVSKSKVHLSGFFSLKSDALKNFYLDSPIETLQFLPIDLQSRSPKAAIQTDFSIRASNFQGVLMLLDGQRINDPQTAHHNSDIPVTSEDIEKIEVIPGVSSSLFGPDAIGGAVNFILKKPKERKLVLELGGGQHRSWGGLFSVSEKIKGLGVRLSAENQESAGFHEDTDFKKITVNLNSSLDLANGEFFADLGFQEKEFGAFDFYTPGSNYPSREWTKTHLLNMGMNLDMNGFIVKPNFLWRRHYDKFMLDQTQVRTRYLNHHRTDLITPNLYLQGQSGLLGRIGGGIEFGEERINSTNLGKHNRQHESIFMDESKDLNKKLSLGLSLRMDNFDTFGQVYSGSASLEHKLSDEASVNFGVSRSIRIPSFTELYYSDPTTLGNAELSAEKSVNIQTGCSYKRERLSLGATLFYRWERDFIDWVKRSSTQTKWEVENISKTQVLGIENHLQLEVNKVISLDSYYTYINKYTYEQGLTYKYGPNFIKHLFNTVFSFKLPFGTQSIAMIYKKKLGRGGWFLLDARLAYSLNKHSRIFLNANNLLDIEYEEIAGIPQPGRWVEGGLRFDW